MFLIKAGRVRLDKCTEEGDNIFLDIRKAGEYMLSDQESEFPVTAACMEKTLLCGFTRRIFHRIVHSHPNIGLEVIKRMSEQVASHRLPPVLEACPSPTWKKGCIGF